MSLNDPIADMLTRIRNATRNRAQTVQVRNSKICAGIAQALKSEGYINDADVIDDGKQGVLRLTLKYGPTGQHLIRKIDRQSKPGCRVYRGYDALPRPLAGLGIAIISTPREAKVGGELLCTVE